MKCDEEMPTNALALAHRCSQKRCVVRMPKTFPEKRARGQAAPVQQSEAQPDSMEPGPDVKPTREMVMAAAGCPSIDIPPMTGIQYHDLASAFLGHKSGGRMLDAVHASSSLLVPRLQEPGQHQSPMLGDIYKWPSSGVAKYACILRLHSSGRMADVILWQTRVTTLMTCMMDRSQ